MDKPKKVLVTLGSSRKIITLSGSVQNARSVILRKAMELFEMSHPLIIQYRDQDFDEWVDMDEDYIPTDKEKLMLVTSQEDDPTMLEVCVIYQEYAQTYQFVFTLHSRVKSQLQ